VVDDEPLAADLIKSYIETVEELQLAGTCHNALDALTMLRKQKIDLLFLDIQMPKLTGLEFIRSLQKPPAIIITTAYREYAVEGFELDVADYLVKPVTLERFLKAINKVMVRQQQPTPAAHTPEADEDPYVYYKVDRQMVKVYLKEILWIESIKDYIKVVLDNNRSLITYQRISYAEEKMPSSLFLRIHRSYIVARSKVTGYGAGVLYICENKLPIGKSYQQRVKSELAFY
jgi:DNA-binding LytR/AlgR family response regulator